MQLPARAQWGILTAAAFLLAVAAAFPLVAPARAEKQPAAEQASSNPGKPKAVGASENQAGGLMGPDRRPAAAPEKRVPAQESREVAEARQRAVAYLIKREDDGKISEYGGQEGGITALATLALLQSGVKPDDRRVSKLLDKVRDVNAKTTYVVSLQTLVLCAAEPNKDLVEFIRRNVEWLEKAQLRTGPRSGAWSYEKDPALRSLVQGDNSNTQFAMLALHEADHAGAPASEKTWLLALDHWLAEQREDGSWGYYRGMDGTGTMTSAGVACVSAASRRVKDKAKLEAAQAALKRAEKWLTDHFTVEANPPSSNSAKFKLWHFSYLSDMERAARLAGWSKIGEHDWRQEGTETLLKMQNRADGSWRGTGFAETDTVIATSLALLFLRSEPPPPSGKADAEKNETYVEGIAVDLEGKPLAGVEVRSGTRALKKATVSGPDGRFRLALLQSIWTPALVAESQDHALIGFSDRQTPAMVYADDEPRAQERGRPRRAEACAQCASKLQPPTGNRLLASRSKRSVRHSLSRTLKLTETDRPPFASHLTRASPGSSLGRTIWGSTIMKTTRIAFGPGRRFVPARFRRPSNFACTRPPASAFAPSTRPIGQLPAQPWFPLPCGFPAS